MHEHWHYEIQNLSSAAIGCPAWNYCREGLNFLAWRSGSTLHATMPLQQTVVTRALPADPGSRQRIHLQSGVQQCIVRNLKVATPQGRAVGLVRLATRTTLAVNPKAVMIHLLAVDLASAWKQISVTRGHERTRVGHPMHACECVLWPSPTHPTRRGPRECRAGQPGLPHNRVGSLQPRSQRAPTLFPTQYPSACSFLGCPLT